MVEPYNDSNALIYSQLGFEGTTYELSLNLLVNLIVETGPFDLVADIGSGSGRTANLISSNIEGRVLGIDVSESMTKEATNSKTSNQIKYILGRGENLPLPSSQIDLVVSANVIEEISSLEILARLFEETHRVLKPGGRFMMLTANPEALLNKAQFITYGYSYDGATLREGDTVSCTITLKDSKIVLQDTYWPTDIIKNLIIDSGFAIENLFKPRADSMVEGLKDETRIAPDFVWSCIKV